MSTTHALDKYPAQDNARTGYEGNLTAQQQTAFNEVWGAFCASEYAGDLKPMLRAEWFVLRFLRATMKDKSGERVFQPALAEQRLYATLQWRRAKNMHQVRDNIRHDNFSPAYHAFANEIKPRLAWFDSRSGRPVTLERLGLLGQYLKMDTYSMDQWEELYVYDVERILMQCEDQSRALGVEVSTKITVYDLTGIGMGMVSRLKLLKLVSELMSQHYPELAGPIFVINAPWTFSTMFALAQPMLDEDTQRKIVVSSKVDYDLLGKAISDARDRFPVELGGNNPEPYPGCCHAPNQQ